MKILAIGDLHRKHQYLNSIFDFYKNGNYDKLIFLGDYADDFLGDARDTLHLWHQLLKRASKDQNIILLMGNHDFAYAYADEFHARFGHNNVQSGFDGATLIATNHALREQLKKSLKITAEFDDVTYSHAGISRTWSETSTESIIDSLWNNHSPIWQRPSNEPNSYPSNFPQVFGHTPINTCTNLDPTGNCWCCDTFSTHFDGTPIGDLSILEVIDGKSFNVIPKSEWHNS